MHPIESRLPVLRRSLALVLLLAATSFAHAVSCTVIKDHPASPAEEAYLRSNYDLAATLYQEQLTAKPHDANAIAALAQIFLKQQKVKEAEDLVQNALASDPKSVVLLTSLGEVQYRAGTPWLATQTAGDAMKIDPCYPQLRLLDARLARLNSLYAIAAKEVATAHALDPYDPQIRRLWLGSLPLKQRIAEMESYIASGSGEDSDALRSLHFYLDFLKSELDTPHKACRLVSDTETATIPFTALMHDATHIHAFGLEVKLNNHNARLQIDTGASGLLISRSVAEHAGLIQSSRTELGGIGDKGERSGYTAFADDIKIGSLEFKDCQVRVIDQRSVIDVDGLIGMDVFSRFLVTLDYPMRKLVLAPLPKRPDDAAEVKPTLQTASSPASEDEEDDTAAGTQTSDIKKAPAGPRDRYVAPEMKDWFRVYRIGHTLLLPASLNAAKQKMFILDTGAFSTTISPEVAREVTKVHPNDNITVKGISGEVKKVYTADEITFRFANISQKVEDVVAFASPQLNKNMGMDVGGLIGITALGQLTVSIDYRDGLMKFSYDANRGYKYPGMP